MAGNTPWGHWLSFVRAELWTVQMCLKLPCAPGKGSVLCHSKAPWEQGRREPCLRQRQACRQPLRMANIFQLWKECFQEPVAKDLKGNQIIIIFNNIIIILSRRDKLHLMDYVQLRNKTKFCYKKSSTNKELGVIHGNHEAIFYFFFFRKILVLRVNQNYTLP